MNRCPQCDHFNIEGASTCERCGAALVTAEAVSIPQPAPTGTSLDGQVLSIAVTGGKIEAIKWYREQTGQGLKESKDAVEALLKQHNVAPKSGCGGMVLLAISLSGAAVGLISRA
jgi:ribosomal protein L7/L12